jgi:hypothetical protein
MDGDQPRYEFRAWADRLDEPVARVRAQSDCRQKRNTIETYILSRDVVGINPKVRGRVLDIKVLRGVEDGFERWEVDLKSGFPVAAALLADKVFPLLGMASTRFDREHYDLDRFLREVVAPHPDLTAVEVVKTRCAHTVVGCMAEVTDVSFGGWEFQTVAVESADLGAVREARGIAGLDRFRNSSYPHFIRGIIGWDAG